MRFRYQYNTRENERREGEIDAASRDDAYRILKQDGIRPSRVELAPGLWNRLRSVGRRWLAIWGLVALVVALSAMLVMEEDEANLFGDTTRRQVLGDTAIIEREIRDGWKDVFEGEGERFLASFAIPGVKAGQRNTTVDEIEQALARTVRHTDADGIEARQIKAMVEGMKQELRAYLKAGGTIVEYGRRLTERQDAELAIRERIKTELEGARTRLSEEDYSALWEQRNDELRNLGIKLIPLPE